MMGGSRLFRCGAFLLFLLSGAMAFGAVTNEPLLFDFGPIVSRQINPNGEVEISALGPIYSSIKSPGNSNSYWGVRPFYANMVFPERDKTTQYYLWPVARTGTFLHEFKWRFLFTWGLHGEVNNPDSDYYRIRIFPVYYQGIGRDDGKFYMAVFPLGGVIKDIYFFDQCKFFLFPIWAKWQQSGTETTSILWPLYSKTTGENVAEKYVNRYGVFPFYRVSEREDSYYKKMVMWPIWTWARYYPQGHSGYAWIFWPLMGRSRFEKEQGLMFLPPFFRYDWGENGKFLLCPWPFIQYRRQRDFNYLYIWPLYGQRKIGSMQTHFVLWPLLWKRSWTGEFLHSRNYQFVPFMIQQNSWELDENRQPVGKAVQRFSKIWPLYEYRREGYIKKFHCFEFWPFIGPQAVDRTWSPLWTVFSHTSNQGSWESQFLWGLYRQSAKGKEQRYSSLFPLYAWKRDDRVQETREWSFLKGLIGYKREGESKSLRLLYFLKFGGKSKETEP